MEATVLLAIAAISLFLLVLGALIDDLRMRARRPVAVAVAKEEEPARRVAAGEPRPRWAAPARPEPPRPPAPDRQLIAASRVARPHLPAPARPPARAFVRPPARAFARLPVPAPRLSANITVDHSTITAEMQTVPARLPVHAAGSVLPIVQRPPTDPDPGEETGEFTVVDVRPPESMPPFTPWPRSPFVPFAPRPEPAAGAPARAPRATPPPPWLRRRSPGVPSWPVVRSPAPAAPPPAPPAPRAPPAPSSPLSPLQAGFSGPTRLVRKK
jgi:hypothetical protein